MIQCWGEGRPRPTNKTGAGKSRCASEPPLLSLCPLPRFKLGKGGEEGEGRFGCAPGLACQPAWRAQVHSGASRKVSRRGVRMRTGASLPSGLVRPGPWQGTKKLPERGPRRRPQKISSLQKVRRKKKKIWLFSQKQANHSRHSENMRLHRPVFPTVSNNSHFL